MKIELLLWLNYALIAWTIIRALTMDREYQDAWVLDGLWIAFFAAIFLYIMLLVSQLELKAFVVLSLGIVFLISSISALKYPIIYGTTIDNGVHVSLAQTIAATGQLDPNSGYSTIPAFHALVAMISDLSNIPVYTLIKILPAFLNILVPLAFYAICTFMHSPVSLTRIVIGFSIFSLWVGPSLLGTAFTIPLLLILLSFVMMRNSPWDGQTSKIGFALLALLFAGAIIFWHAITSAVVPFIIFAAGLVSWLAYRRKPASGRFYDILPFGLLGLLAVLTYWMYGAGFIWEKLGANLRILLLRDNIAPPIPSRLFQIPLLDQVKVAAQFHAKDALLVVLALVGVVFLLKLRQRSDYDSPLWMWSIFWCISFSFVLLVLISGFGNQGYERFLLYVIALSPIPAGYGVYRLLNILGRDGFHWQRQLVLFLIMLVISVVGVLQSYPYQPAVPSGGTSGTSDGSDPLVWLHQVNTEYQISMLEFAHSQIPSTSQTLLDRFGYDQFYLMYGSQSRDRERYVADGKPGNAFFLLHWPGKAGGFVEQLEYRSEEAIAALRDTDNVETVYDNGQSFILYLPSYANLPALRTWK